MCMLAFPFSDLFPVSEPRPAQQTCRYCPTLTRACRHLLGLGATRIIDLSEDESSLIAFRRRLEGFKYVHVRTDLRLALGCTGPLPGRLARDSRVFHPPAVATNPAHFCPKSNSFRDIDFTVAWTGAIGLLLSYFSDHSTTILTSAHRRLSPTLHVYNPHGHHNKSTPTPRRKSNRTTVALPAYDSSSRHTSNQSRYSSLVHRRLRSIASLAEIHASADLSSPGGHPYETYTSSASTNLSSTTSCYIQLLSYCNTVSSSIIVSRATLLYPPSQSAHVASSLRHRSYLRL